MREETDLRLGIEADYVRGTEDRMANLLDQHEWDYVLGSVHFLGEFAVDFDDETDIWRHETTAERVWKRYFDALAESALTGIFDVITHPDLVKIWGSGRPQPSKDPRFYYEPRDRGDARRGRRDGGLHRRAAQAGRRDLPGAGDARDGRRRRHPDRALQRRPPARAPRATATRRRSSCSTDCGVNEIAVFEKRARRMEPLG